MKFGLISLIVLSAKFVCAADSYLEGVKRSELFEITDFKVPKFSITIPEEQYVALKQSVNKNSNDNTAPIDSDDPCASVKATRKLVESLGVNIEQLAGGGAAAGNDGAAAAFMQNAGIDADTAAAYMQQMQNGDIASDPEALMEQMKNAGIDPETAAAYLQQMQNAKKEEKPKEYDTKPPIYQFKDAKLEFTLDDSHAKSFDNVKFEISGSSSLFNYKSSFRIGIKESENLYGVNDILLKSDIVDGSMLTTKLVSDLRLKNDMEVPQANYAELFINGQYMGLYVMTESFKKHWAMNKYGLEEVNNLYKCDNGKLTYVDGYNGCTNENEKADKLEWETFLKTLDAAKTEKDIETIFDIEGYLKNAAFDYLNGSIDHYTAGAYHNFYMFKASETAKWQYIPYDFDNDLYAFNYENNSLTCNTGIDYTKYFDKNAKLNQLLIFSNPQRFEKMVRELTETLWNPVDLYQRIDQLKEFLTPYMKKDRAIGENGHVAGFINEQAQYINHENTFDEWSHYVEYASSTTFGCGLKRWIVEKYRFVCDNHAQCDTEKVAFAKSVQYDSSFVDQVSKENEKIEAHHGAGTGNGNAGIGDSQAKLTMEEQYNVFKVCDSVDIFYVMANYYGWDTSKMVIDPETGLAVLPNSEASSEKENTENKASDKEEKENDAKHHEYLI